jgi:tetratricopeptide (TPR) repeat protein
MTTPTRLELLLEYYREDPNDPFNIYALAMEYLNTDQKKALYYLEGLLKWHPNYLPTYYQAGKAYTELGELETALEIYRLGQNLADTLGEKKTLDELKRAERMVLDEMED